jgi:hypothetical protein
VSGSGAAHIVWAEISHASFHSRMFNTRRGSKRSEDYPEAYKGSQEKYSNNYRGTVFQAGESFMLSRRFNSADAEQFDMDESFLTYWERGGVHK